MMRIDVGSFSEIGSPRMWFSLFAMDKSPVGDRGSILDGVGGSWVCERVSSFDE